MDRQTVFNTVATALIAQGKPAITTEGDCQYRVAHTDLKCAAGHLLPDAEYRPEMEGMNASNIAFSSYSPTLAALGQSVTTAFLDAIQTAHDGGIYMLSTNGSVVSYPPELRQAYPTDWLATFKARMRFLAMHYELDDTLVQA